MVAGGLPKFQKEPFLIRELLGDFDLLFRRNVGGAGIVGVQPLINRLLPGQRDPINLTIPG